LEWLEIGSELLKTEEIEDIIIYYDASKEK
jgi:hypothetical protein